METVITGGSYGEFSLYDRNVYIDKELVEQYDLFQKKKQFEKKYVDVKAEVKQFISQQVKLFNQGYNRKTITSIKKYMEYIDDFYENAVEEGIDKIYISLLAGENEYLGIGKKDCYSGYVEASNPLAISQINDRMEAAVEIIETNAEEMRRYRELRKASRGRIIGGGFGIKGAVKGMVTAGIANAAWGGVHSIGNAIGNACTESAKRKKLGEVFHDAEIKRHILSAVEYDLKGLLNVIEAIHYAFVKQNQQDGFQDIDFDKIEKEIQKELVSARQDEQTHKQKICESLQRYPMCFDIYEDALKYFGDVDNTLQDIAMFVGEDIWILKELQLHQKAEEIEKEKYGEAYQEELTEYAVFLGLDLESERREIETYTSDRNEQVIEDKLCLLNYNDISDLDRAIEWLGGLNLEIAEDKQRQLYRKKQDIVVSQGKLTDGLYVTDEALRTKINSEKKEIQRIYREMNLANAESVQNGIMKLSETKMQCFDVNPCVEALKNCKKIVENKIQNNKMEEKKLLDTKANAERELRNLKAKVADEDNLRELCEGTVAIIILIAYFSAIVFGINALLILFFGRDLLDFLMCITPLTKWLADHTLGVWITVGIIFVLAYVGTELISDSRGEMTEKEKQINKLTVLIGNYKAMPDTELITELEAQNADIKPIYELVQQEGMIRYELYFILQYEECQGQTFLFSLPENFPTDFSLKNGHAVLYHFDTCTGYPVTIEVAGDKLKLTGKETITANDKGEWQVWLLFFQTENVSARIGLKESKSDSSLEEEEQETEEKVYVTQISAGERHLVGLLSDGTVVATGEFRNERCNVGDWKSIARVYAGKDYTVGIRTNGTVVYTGEKHNWQEVYEWENVVEISLYDDYFVGRTRDGRVYSTTIEDKYDRGKTKVSEWTNIEHIYAGKYATIGIRTDGTLAVAKGFIPVDKWDIEKWQDIVKICTDIGTTVALKADGTVIRTTFGDDQFYLKLPWTNIIDISACNDHIVGLRSDGTVVATGLNHAKQCNVSSWRDVVEVIAQSAYTVGVKTGGLVVATTATERSMTANVKNWTEIIQVCTSDEFIAGLQIDGTVLLAGGESRNYRYDLTKFNNIKKSGS